MKQILQNLRDGETAIVEVPSPKVGEREVLIRTLSSLISLGTEKMLINFGRSGWFSKAKQQPDKVRLVLDRMKTDGLFATFDAVNSKLDERICLGYSNVGEVIETGRTVSKFKPGDLVVSNGPHAEIVSVGKNLVSKVPEGVSVESASFTVVGSIALQGIRLLSPQLGEVVAVIGLGLIGLMAVQLLRAQGCKVIGIDFEGEKCRLAENFGAIPVDLSLGQDPISIAAEASDGNGIDGVLITASTKSNQPIHQAAQMCRKRGRIVLTGVTGLELARADFYEKELSFQVSCSYGPGRYDPMYEREGNDYPFAFVRWTEQRNFGAVLGMIADSRMDTASLVSHRFKFSDALDAYREVRGSKALGILLSYDSNPESRAGVSLSLLERSVQLRSKRAFRHCPVTIGLIGAGGFARKVLVPALRKTPCRLKTVVSTRGVSGTQLAVRFGFEESSTDTQRVLGDPEIDTVVIATRHDSHSDLVIRSLEAGKKTYVEKPLCLTMNELRSIEAVYIDLVEKGRNPFLMVGFNRRFSPHVRKMKTLLKPLGLPLAMSMTVNAGALSADHWVQDGNQGGGRIIGEACHFIDLLRFLSGAPIVEVASFTSGSEGRQLHDESSTIQLEFSDGSIGSIHYFTNGHRGVSKERIEVFVGGKVLALDNFRRLRGFGWNNFRNMNLWRQDKGHFTEIESLVGAVRDGAPSPISFGEILEVTRASFQAAALCVQSMS